MAYVVVYDEVVRILTDLCDQIERTRSVNPTITLRDGNGNKVGYATVYHQERLDV